MSGIILPYMGNRIMSEFNQIFIKKLGATVIV